MRLAAVDIGTNSLLLLIADVTSEGIITPIRDEQVIARLGKGVDARGIILPETFTRVTGFLKTYVQMARSAEAQEIVATGTSALRDAANREEFIRFAQAETGLEIQVLSGEDEALLTYEGVVSEFRDQNRQQQYGIIDIGGGSTELILGKGWIPEIHQSVDMGSVRLTERYFGSGPLRDKEVQSAQTDIRDAISKFPAVTKQTELIGVAGTVTTLAALDLELEPYDPTLISGHVLTRVRIQEIFDMLKVKRVEDIRLLPQIVPGREDVIRGGILILLELLDLFSAESLRVSDRGLRYGVALRKAQKRL